LAGHWRKTSEIIHPHLSVPHFPVGKTGRKNVGQKNRRREQVSTYGEECGNKISRKFTPGVFDHYQVNNGKSDFATPLRSNEFIV
jgi:hypothetical protein